ncbi:hypothetical protein BN2497_2299 [Janthinobacterium sp. CG23_2]|nr:hypothetical protein BN2497_2299 [Janthinobacterium sp. CG23_2]CUU27547.1 hypothetical protein BN3177_2299 [Janthinobacterium sp. CG23_2]
MECWQHECCGLARTGLRRNQQVAPADGGRNSLLLNRGRNGVTCIGYCFYDRRVEA